MGPVLDDPVRHQHQIVAPRIGNVEGTVCVPGRAWRIYHARVEAFTGIGRVHDLRAGSFCKVPTDAKFAVIVSETVQITTHRFLIG